MSVISSMVVALSADTKRFSAGMSSAVKTLKRVQSAMNSTGTVATAMGGTITAAAVTTTKAFIDAGSAAVDMSERTGVAIETIQRLNYAAGQNATTIETVEKGLKVLAKGVANNSAAFQKFGIDLDAIRGLAPDEQFLRIADSIAAIEDPTRKSAAAQAIFGKAGAELIPLLNQGSAGILAMGKTADDLGIVLSSNAARGAEEFGDTLDTLYKQFTALAVQVGAAVLPVVRDMVTYIQGVIPSVSAWIQNNGVLIASVAAVGAALSIIGPVLFGLSATIGAVVSAFSALSTVAGVVAGVIGAITAPVWGTVAAVVALVAGLTALVTWFLTSTEAGQGLVSWLYDGAIAGFNALWTMLEDFGAWLSNTFGFLFEAAGNVAVLAWKGVTLYFQTVWTVLKTIASWVGAVMQPAWELFGSAATFAIKALGKSIEALIAPLKWVLEKLGLISKEAAKIPEVAAALPAATTTAPKAPSKQPRKPVDQRLIDDASRVADILGSSGQFTKSKETFRFTPRDEAAIKNKLLNDALGFLDSVGSSVNSGKNAQKTFEFRPAGPAAAPAAVTRTTSAIGAGSAEFLTALAARQAPQEEARKAEKEAQKLRRMQVTYLRKIAENGSGGGVQLASIGGA